ncbi:MAG: hypothetical protein ACE5HQ_02475 [Gemmatimonadota bacterium]
MSSGLGVTGGVLARVAQLAARRRVGSWRREFLRPWRRGRGGVPAEVGRWVGLGLAVGAVVAGLAAALYSERSRG